MKADKVAGLLLDSGANSKLRNNQGNGWHKNTSKSFEKDIVHQNRFNGSVLHKVFLTI